MRKIIVLTVALATILFSFNASAQQPQRRITPNDTLKSVRVLPDGSAVFSIYAPKARTVSLTACHSCREGWRMVVQHPERQARLLQVSFHCGRSAGL